MALAVALLVVTLYLVEQRCRGVICPSELLGSQNRIRALWKKPSHSALGGLLPCLQARQCLDLGLESPLSAQAFFGELHHKDNNPFNNAQGGHSQHNSRQKKNVYPIECTLGRSSTIHVAFLKLNLCTCLDNWGFGKCLSKRLDISLDHSF